MEKIIKFEKELRQSKKSYNFFANIHDDIRRGSFQRIIDIRDCSGTVFG